MFAMQQENSQKNKAVLYLVITALLWSMGGILIKSITWNPLAIAGTRSIIAVLVMLAVNPHPKFTWSGAQLGAAVAYALTMIFFVTATKLTTAANAILLQYTAPIYAALFGAWFLGERATKLDWLTILLVLGGMAFFFGDQLSLGGMLGNLAAIVSGVFFAGTAIFMRKQKDGSNLESLMLGNLFTAIIGLFFMFDGNTPNLQGWIALGILGVFQIGVAYIFYAKAMKQVTALEGLLIPVLEPILNPVWVGIFLHERPGKFAVFGGLIVLGAVTMRSVILLKRQNNYKTKEEVDGCHQSIDLL